MDNSKHCLQITDAFPKEVLTLSISQPLVRRVSRAWVEPVDTVRSPAPNPNQKGRYDDAIHDAG